MQLSLTTRRGLPQSPKCTPIPSCNGLVALRNRRVGSVKSESPVLTVNDTLLNLSRRRDTLEVATWMSLSSPAALPVISIYACSTSHLDHDFETHLHPLWRCELRETGAPSNRNEDRHHQDLILSKYINSQSAMRGTKAQVLQFGIFVVPNGGSCQIIWYGQWQRIAQNPSRGQYRHQRHICF